MHNWSGNYDNLNPKAKKDKQQKLPSLSLEELKEKTIKLLPRKLSGFVLHQILDIYTRPPKFQPTPAKIGITTKLGP